MKEPVWIMSRLKSLQKKKLFFFYLPQYLGYDHCWD